MHCIQRERPAGCWRRARPRRPHAHVVVAALAQHGAHHGVDVSLNMVDASHIRIPHACAAALLADAHVELCRAVLPVLLRQLLIAGTNDASGALPRVREQRARTLCCHAAAQHARACRLDPVSTWRPAHDQRVSWEPTWAGTVHMLHAHCTRLSASARVGGPRRARLRGAAGRAAT
jgi:hypothetical protein